MSESFRLTCCCHGVAPESKLSRTPRQHHSFHGNTDIIRGKNIKNMSCGVPSIINGMLRLILEDQFFMFFSSFNSSRNFKQLSKQIIHQHLRLYDVAVCVMPDAISRNHDEL